MWSCQEKKLNALHLVIPKLSHDKKKIKIEVKMELFLDFLQWIASNSIGWSSRRQLCAREGTKEREQFV